MTEENLRKATSYLSVLWFTENGRDWLGDNRPPDELNRAPGKGLHFGFPYCHGNNIPDPLHSKEGRCDAYVPPARELGPHVAALGMRFYDGTMFPEEYHNQIFIAEHGSWNRTEPIGYRITRIRLEGEQAVSYDIFAEGWLQDGKAWGRPGDVMVMPDGALLISNDRAGAVYRISYRKRHHQTYHPPPAPALPRRQTGTGPYWGQINSTDGK